MEYKVVPIFPVQKKNEDAKALAQNFEIMIQNYNAQGWQYIRTESLKVWVDGNSGCFGIVGATPGYYAERQMLVFKK